MAHNLGSALSGLSKPGKNVTNSITSGPASKKTVKGIVVRPEGKVSIDAGNLKAGHLSDKTTAGGSAKNLSAGSGHRGIHIGVRPEPSVKRDAASVAKPFKG